jgi:phage terminase large subunit GpA
MTDRALAVKELRAGISAPPPDIIKWAESNVRFPASVQSEYFRAGISPWIIDPIRNAVDRTTRIITLCKPIQSGGSAAGEVVLLYWILFRSGFLQYNWSTDKRARERWDSRVEAILRACRPVAAVMDRLPLHDATKGEISFPNVFLRLQGAFVADNLDSDSVPLQLNEEVHSWEPGHLAKARGRSSAVYDFKSFDISNAGRKGDQLSEACNEGTRQAWENICPACGEPHRMHLAQWDDQNPQKGGLRYDSEKSKRKDGTHDYNILNASLRYQFPCGYLVRNDPYERKQLSVQARYSDVASGSDLSHRSYSYSAVAVDFIPWLTIIKEKHQALRALKAGDPEPFRRWQTERECQPFDLDEAPYQGGSVVLTSDVKKNREGLPGEKLRLFALDFQAGHEGKADSHFWMIIRDLQFDAVRARLRSRLVFEGKLESQTEVLRVLAEHECGMGDGVCDSGFDTEAINQFCYQNCIHSVKGGTRDYYIPEENGARRCLDKPQPLCKMLDRPPRTGHVNHPQEPKFWIYSKQMIRHKLAWLRDNTDWETPTDVSDTYLKHMQAEVLQKRQLRTGETIFEWIQQRERNDLYVCECYIAMQIDMSTLMASQIPIPSTETKK